jgi:hypothetical protein
MTCHTSFGPRTLTGAEAIFYLTATREALKYLIEWELVQPWWKAADAKYGEDEETNAFHSRSDNYSLWRIAPEHLT